MNSWINGFSNAIIHFPHFSKQPNNRKSNATVLFLSLSLFFFFPKKSDSRKIQQLNLSPNLVLGWIWYLNRLFWVGHTYYCFPFYSIQSYNLCYFLNWHIYLCYIWTSCTKSNNPWKKELTPKLNTYHEISKNKETQFI